MSTSTAGSSYQGVTNWGGTWYVTMINSVQDTFNALLSKFSAATRYPINTYTAAANSASISGMGQSLQAVQSRVEGLVEFEVPYYNVSHISPATIYDSNTPQKPITVTETLKGSVPPVIISLHPQGAADLTTSSMTLKSDVYKAAGDDFSLMYLVGVPPLVNVPREI